MDADVEVKWNVVKWKTSGLNIAEIYAITDKTLH